MTITEKIDLQNAQTRMIVTMMLALGVLWGLFWGVIGADVFMQTTGMVLAFWFGQKTTTSPAGPTPTMAVTSPPGAETTTTATTTTTVPATPGGATP
jgi:hypothetical protein